MSAAASSVRSKLARVVLLSTLAALVVAIAAMVAYDLRLYHQGWIAELTARAELLGRTSAPALAFDDQRMAQENLALMRHSPQVRAAALYSPRGQVFASYAPGEARFPDLPEADGARIEGNDLVIFKRIVNGKEIIGTVYLRAQYELWDRLLGYVGIAVGVGVVAMLVAYLLSEWMQRAVTRPLRSITEAAREVAERGNYEARVEKLSNDEIGMLADAFNGMLAEIARATSRLEASNADAARELAERRRAEGEVLRLNSELENRVKERTAQLEYTNAELEAFCYSVSHDLRAPLRAIDGFSQALVEDYGQDLPDEAKHYLSRVRSSTLRMAQLIEDLLNLSRVSRTELQRTNVDVAGIARTVVAELQQREPARKVEVSIWEPMQADADPRLLRAAFENLVGNAWKFTGKAEQPRIEIGMTTDGGGTQTFFVRDNGAGFDMAYANKLFGAFQRLHSANEYQGTGIGLATVQRIVHRHGGRIWADGKPGKGAVFYFTLRASAAEVPGIPASSTPERIAHA